MTRTKVRNERKFRFSQMNVLAGSDEFHLNDESSLKSSTSSSSSSDGSAIRSASPTFVDYGLAITIQDGACQFHLCPDKNYPKIHPHVYAPSNLKEMEILHGGGSGVSVFGAKSPKYGDLVMKHGNFKDLQELFALVTIAKELKSRGVANKQSKAALHMQQCLPEFKMIYISPFHIVDRGIFWDQIRVLVDSYSTTIRFPEGKRRAGFMVGDTSLLDCLMNHGMNIRMLEHNHNTVAIELDTTSKNERSLSVMLPKQSCQKLDSKTVSLVRESPYEGLKETVEELLPIMTEGLYKFTLGQKKIGGKQPKTGSQWLYEGKLTGPVLDNLITQFIQVLRNLQKLTLPEEVDVVEQVRQELKRLEQADSSSNTTRVSDISDLANTFVGYAIKKNFDQDKGRVPFLRRIGQHFRNENLVLTPEEVFPAKCMGALLHPDALMSDTFLEAPAEHTFCPGDEFWKNILRRAVDDRETMSPSALKRVWNCGLTDAGLHNLFVSKDDLHIFDLSEPQLESLPAFLTKFLFSFFHNLGMEEDDSGSWVRRFEIDGEKLRLTKETKELIPKAYAAFEKALDRLIEELFDGDRKLRLLLLQYVTLQLLSDTAFCLQKWVIKGGGRDRKDNHQRNIEKWLWRALWDIYIASDINTKESWVRFKVSDPGLQRARFRLSLLEGNMSIRHLLDG